MNETGSNISDTDYELEEGASVWITVNNLSVNVAWKDEGVSVSVYPLDNESDPSITETWALFSEGEGES